MKIGTIILISVVAVLVFSGVSCYGYVNSTRNDGIAMEQQMAKEYEDNQNFLSSYVSSIYEQLGLANRKSAVLDTILTNAVKGRYGDNGFKPNGAMFSAIAEAYPDLTKNLDIFDKIADHVSAGREEFRGRQSKLLDETRAYRTWLQQGIFQHMVISYIGFPTDNLQARVGGKIVAEGSPALNKIEDIVITNSTDSAFTSGRMNPLDTRH